MSKRFVLIVAAAIAAAGSVIKPAEAEPLARPVVGPMLVCFKYSTFQLGRNERIVDFAASPEGMSVTVEGQSGSFKIDESEIFASPPERRRLVAKVGRTSVYRVRKGLGRYAIYGPTDFSEGKDRLVIWLEGDDLQGSKSDESIYGRIIVQETDGLKCRHIFTYSWYSE